MNREQFNELKEQYIKALPSMKKSDRTIHSYSMVLDKFGDHLARTEEQDEDISPIAVSSFRTELFNAGIKTNTIAQYLTVLHAFFEWAMRMKVIEQNPVLKDDMPKSQEIERDHLSLDEINKILTEVPSEINHKTALRNRAIVVLLIQTGLRNAELRALTLSNIDFEKNCIEIPHGKGDKRRYVAFPALSRQIIQEYLESGVRPSNLSPNDYLFGTDADENGISTEGKIWKPFSSTGLLGLVNRYTRLCCGHEVGVHALRHSAVSLWAEMGVEPRAMQQALGHSSFAFTERIYLHTLNLQGAASQINTAFDKKVLHAL